MITLASDPNSDAFLKLIGIPTIAMSLSATIYFAVAGPPAGAIINGFFTALASGILGAFYYDHLQEQKNKEADSNLTNDLLEKDRSTPEKSEALLHDSRENTSSSQSNAVNTGIEQSFQEQNALEITNQGEHAL